jgi:hypothetical protein
MRGEVRRGMGRACQDVLAFEEVIQVTVGTAEVSVGTFMTDAR